MKRFLWKAVQIKHAATTFLPCPDANLRADDLTLCTAITSPDMHWRSIEHDECLAIHEEIGANTSTSGVESMKWRVSSMERAGSGQLEAFLEVALWLVRIRLPGSRKWGVDVNPERRVSCSEGDLISFIQNWEPTVHGIYRPKCACSAYMQHMALAHTDWVYKAMI